MPLNKALAIAVAIVAVLSQGCNPLKKNRPSKDQIMTLISGEVPAFMTVVDITPQYLPGATQNEWLINVKATIAPKEDLLGLPSAADMGEINDLVSQNNAVLSWYARRCVLNRGVLKCSETPGSFGLRESMVEMEQRQLILNKTVAAAGIWSNHKIAQDSRIDST